MYFNFRMIRPCSPHWVKNQLRASHFRRITSERMISTSDDNDKGNVAVTKSEAISFVEGVLGLPNPVESAKEQPFDLLCEIHKKIKTSVPFSNLTYVNRYGTRNLSLEERKRTVFAKQGGGCFDVYPVVQAVLQHLDFDTSLISGSLSTSRTSLAVSHVGLVVNNATYPGSQHLLEPGTRHPILQPVPLDFTKISSEYKLGHYSVRFFKDDPGIMKMCSPVVDGRDVSENALTFDGKVWDVHITYRLRENLSPYDCQKVRECVVSDSKTIPDMHGRLVIFGFSRGLWTSIVGNKLYQYGKSGSTGYAVKTMKNDSEIIETIHQCFPQYPTHQIAEALTGASCQN